MFFFCDSVQSTVFSRLDLKRVSRNINFSNGKHISLREFNAKRKSTNYIFYNVATTRGKNVRFNGDSVSIHVRTLFHVPIKTRITGREPVIKNNSCCAHPGVVRVRSTGAVFCTRRRRVRVYKFLSHWQSLHSEWNLRAKAPAVGQQLGRGGGVFNIVMRRLSHIFQT